MYSKSKTFLILGSGVTASGFKIRLDSKNFDPPMDRNFFNTDVVKKLYNQEKFPALHFFQNLRVLGAQNTESSLEKIWSDIDLASKLTNDQLSRQKIVSMAHDYKKIERFLQKKAENNPNFKDNLNCQLSWVGKGGCIGPLASWEAVELILQIYGNLKKDSDSAFLDALKCIISNSDLKGIATFNYDLSTESIWPDLKVKEKLFYYDPIHSSGYINGIPLYKLHGSINWYSNFKRESRWIYAIPETFDKGLVDLKFNQGSFIGGSPNEVVEPAIIPPDLFKQNITLDIQNDLKSILFKKIWNGLWEQLNGVEILIFIGFSFPDTDHHAKLLFGEANRRNPFNKVIINTKSGISLPRYISIFGKGAIIPFSGGIQSMVQREDELISLLKP